MPHASLRLLLLLASLAFASGGGWACRPPLRSPPSYALREYNIENEIYREVPAMPYWDRRHSERVRQKYKKLAERENARRLQAGLPPDKPDRSMEMEEFHEQIRGKIPTSCPGIFHHWVWRLHRYDVEFLQKATDLELERNVPGVSSFLFFFFRHLRGGVRTLPASSYCPRADALDGLSRWMLHMMRRYAKKEPLPFPFKPLAAPPTITKPGFCENLVRLSKEELTHEDRAILRAFPSSDSLRQAAYTPPKNAHHKKFHAFQQKILELYFSKKDGPDFCYRDDGLLSEMSLLYRLWEFVKKGKS